MFTYSTILKITPENYNKAVLIKNGILVHKIKRDKSTKKYHAQFDEIPIKIKDFIGDFGTSVNNKKEIYLNGLHDNFQTFGYSSTLSEEYQKIIGLDRNLKYHLIKINERRSRLHFFTDFKGAFEVNSHIAKWKFVMETSITTIENALKGSVEQLKESLRQ